jgi:hypothetical protein
MRIKMEYETRIAQERIDQEIFMTITEHYRRAPVQEIIVDTKKRTMKRSRMTCLWKSHQNVEVKKF